jgi:hypothetical protein
MKVIIKDSFFYIEHNNLSLVCFRTPFYNLERKHIKNGMVISCFRGCYEEALFSPPIILLFSNLEVEPFVKYLSFDRWKVFKIDENQNLIERKSDLQQLHTYHHV